ncbi:hypothetical protein FJT64_001946 [Amphibalanus amphitrite]|uniref:Uncharacterized protein n=1 Tax=Amphibalanus amphitrite TaxID=1232801 RepID=A0A6A4X706_AMPAM|nr:hypothetical protein FJT64_001946 [Amphibalanus amphitrite]
MHIAWNVFNYQRLFSDINYIIENYCDISCTQGWRSAEPTGTLIEIDAAFVFQERDRITTSIQNDLYISPVTSADLGWWVCAATSAAGSVASRVLLHTGPKPPDHEVKVTPSSLHSELVHLEEVKVTGQHSVRLTWKTSDRRPVDGFYICYILLLPADGEVVAPSQRSRAAPSDTQLRRVTVLNGGAESYELTGLRAGAAYQLFLVPFRAGREGRLSRLREVRLPEAGQCWGTEGTRGSRGQEGSG